MVVKNTESWTKFSVWNIVQKYGQKFNIIQLLTFVEVDMKCYWTVNFILTDAKRRSVWFVYCSTTLHVHRNKSQQLSYYIKRIFQLKDLSFSRLDVKFQLTLHHKPCDITTLRHRPSDITWSDVTVHATLGRYVTNHATSSIVNLTWLAFIYSLYNKGQCFSWCILFDVSVGVLYSVGWK